MRVRQKTRIGVYGRKTRDLQRRMTYEAFKMTFKTGNVYKYLGDRHSIDPNINDLGNITFSEVNDRAYDKESYPIYIGMEPMSENAMDLSQYGIINPMGDDITIRVHVNDFECLGRPIIVGDAIEIPFYRDGECREAFFEVSDVDDKPSYEKYYYTVTIHPMNDSRKTREIDLDRSNEDVFSDVMQEADEKYEEEVPFEGLDEGLVDGEFTPPSEPVDYRNKKQKSFLDDPFYDFTHEDK